MLMSMSTSHRLLIMWSLLISRRRLVSLRTILRRRRMFFRGRDSELMRSQVITRARLHKTCHPLSRRSMTLANTESTGECAKPQSSGQERQQKYHSRWVCVPKNDDECEVINSTYSNNYYQMMLVRNLLTRALLQTFSTAKPAVSLKKGQISQVRIPTYRSSVQSSMCSSKETSLPSSMPSKWRESRTDWCLKLHSIWGIPG